MSILNGASHFCQINKSKATIRKETIDECIAWFEDHYYTFLSLTQKQASERFRKAMEGNDQPA